MSDPLAAAVLGLRSSVHRVRALVEAAAPPLGEGVDAVRTPDRSTAPETLALLGLISMCARLEALYERVAALPPEGDGPRSSAAGSSLLR